MQTGPVMTNNCWLTPNVSPSNFISSTGIEKNDSSVKWE